MRRRRAPVSQPPAPKDENEHVYQALSVFLQVIADAISIKLQGDSFRDDVLAILSVLTKKKKYRVAANGIKEYLSKPENEQLTAEAFDKNLLSHCKALANKKTDKAESQAALAALEGKVKAMAAGPDAKIFHAAPPPQTVVEARQEEQKGGEKGAIDEERQDLECTLQIGFEILDKKRWPNIHGKQKLLDLFEFFNAIQKDDGNISFFIKHMLSDHQNEHRKKLAEPRGFGLFARYRGTLTLRQLDVLADKIKDFSATEAKRTITEIRTKLSGGAANAEVSEFKVGCMLKDAIASVMKAQSSEQVVGAFDSSSSVGSTR